MILAPSPMRPDELSIATITWARDPSEEALLRQSLVALAAFEVPCTVADARSPAPFLEFVDALPYMRVAPVERPGLVPQVKAALRGAADRGTPFILYTEPDKLPFFDRSLASFVERLPTDAALGTALVARSARSFATFPAIQQRTERAINDLCAYLIGQPGDYSYGPFVLNRLLVPLIEQIPDELGWGWRHFTFGIARRLNLRVLHICDDLECPPEQRDEPETERAHRLRQLSQNVEGLRLSLLHSL
jgi:hypothetical protein